MTLLIVEKSTDYDTLWFHSKDRPDLPCGNFAYRVQSESLQDMDRAGNEV